MITHLDFIQDVALTGRHTLISTGMSTLGDIDTVVEVFREAMTPFSLLHCVSVYPCPPEYCNIKMVETLRNRYACEVGYSGHETGIGPSLAAVALGATIIERHLTLDRADFGSDHAASLEPTGLRRLVNHIRELEAAMGDGIKRFAPGEEGVAEKLRYW